MRGQPVLCRTESRARQAAKSACSQLIFEIALFKGLGVSRKRLPSAEILLPACEFLRSLKLIVYEKGRT
jgi:hypothetical protein